MGLIPSSLQSADTDVSRWAFDSANFLPPLRPLGLEPGQGAFADQIPFELGQRREDAEHEAASRGGGVDLCALTGARTRRGPTPREACRAWISPRGLHN